MNPPLDANGKPLKVGDMIYLPAKLTQIVAHGKRLMLIVQHPNGDDTESVRAMQPRQVVKAK